MGLRELKKERTRKAISDLATKLFLERGYHNVTTAEIAEKAEVSVPTLFKYFQTKEAMVFDEDSEIEAWLINTVINREKGQSILDALLEGGIERIESIPSSHKKSFKVFMDLVERTPELNLYSKQMWMRHEIALGSAIRKEARAKIGKIESGAIARFVLDSYHRSIGTTNPKATLKAMFSILEKGWDN